MALKVAARAAPAVVSLGRQGHWSGVRRMGLTRPRLHLYTHARVALVFAGAQLAR
jgi:hypothetical protein